MLPLLTTVYAEGVAYDPLTIVQTGGVVGLLLVILLGGNRGWWVFGWQYRSVEKEKEEWKATALKLLHTAESLSELPPPKQSA